MKECRSVGGRRKEEGGRSVSPRKLNEKQSKEMLMRMMKKLYEDEYATSCIIVQMTQ
jgi:hypothetical protein